MTYQRKTRDRFIIQGRYPGPHGWEDENEEDNRADARRSLREYRANGPGLYRLVKRRERITPQAPT